MTTMSIQEPSVRSLLIQMAVRGQVLSTGTAFILTDRSQREWLITNRHNLSGRRSDTNEPLSPTAATPDTVVIMHNSAVRLGSWIVRTQPLLDAEDRPLWLEHPLHGRAVDVVALPLEYDSETALYRYSLHDPGLEVAIYPSSDLSVVGFPFGITSGGFLAVWTRATVASEYQVDFNGLPSFLIDARTRPGQSGSPVIYHSTGGLVPTGGGGSTLTGPVTKLLGVYSGRINNESDLGLVWRLSAVSEIVESGVRPQAN